jgi:malonyl-CoA O-methyltransferase
MILTLADRNVRKAFSGAAERYDARTRIHKEIGRDLIERITSTKTRKAVLDIGMGTGWLTNQLKFYFPGSTIVGIDFADGMIESARRQNQGVGIIQADARALPFQEKAFDLIVSNLAYQWVPDLNQAFGLCHSVLQKGGAFHLTLFGRQTFRELFLCLAYARRKLNRDRGCSLRRLAGSRQVSEALARAGFRDVHVEPQLMKIHFPDIWSLLRWIKAIGANALGGDTHLGKGMIAAADEYYRRHYRDSHGIFATLEVLWARGWK